MSRSGNLYPLITWLKFIIQLYIRTNPSLSLSLSYVYVCMYAFLYMYACADLPIFIFSVALLERTKNKKWDYK